MAELEASVRAPYSVLFVGGPHGEAPSPDELADRFVAATSGSVAIGTLADCDGATRVCLIVSDESPGVLPPILAFDGLLKLSFNKLTVESAHGEIYLERLFAGPEAHVRVFTNRRTEPDEIVILVE